MSRPRGRPRTFDEEEMLLVVMRLFWEKGYSATSLSDIAAVTGLSRPSLYAAYGGKLEMYLASMEVYAGRMRQRVLPPLQRGPTLEAALEGFYEGALELFFENGDGSAFGCLLFGTASAEAPSEAEIQRNLAEKIAGIDLTLRRAIERLAPGSSSEAVDVAVTLASATLHSIGLRARSGASRKELVALARRSVRTICGGMGASQA